MASRALPVLPRLDAMEPERPPPALPSELLEEIFLRVASPTDLVRASAACVSFRGLITNPSFLRRYRSIHPPLLLGFLGRGALYEFHPVEAAHPSAAIGRAVASSFDYLPLDSYYPLDVRDGRVLVACPGQNGIRDFAVCDPLSQRHLLLPPITHDLLASVEIQSEGLKIWGGSFIPSGGIEEDTSFGVISWIVSGSRLGVFIISSGSSCWNVSKSISWDDLGLDQFDMMTGHRVYGVYDCFYWRLYEVSTVIKLDINSMQFCTVGLPPDHNDRRILIVGSGQSKVAMFSVSHHGTSVDYYTFLQNTSDKSHEWHMISTIPLPAHYAFARFIHGPADGYIFLDCTRDEEESLNCSTVFSLEIKSSNIKRVSRMDHYDWEYAYFGFPPSMSPRRI